MLLVGTLLAPGKRTVTAALRVLGLAHSQRFERYHRVRNRAQWSSLAAGRVLLGLLVAAFVPTGPLLVGIDATIERRRGQRIAAKGLYRAPVRSSQAPFVKASGLRWIGLMLRLGGIDLERAGQPEISAIALDPAHFQSRTHFERQWAEVLLWLSGAVLEVVP